MKSSFRIAIAQIDPVVGDFEQNIKQIEEIYERACQKQARLLLTPELGVCGYPPHDLIYRPEIFERNERALKDLEKLTGGKECILSAGYIARNPKPSGRPAQNVISLLYQGKRIFTQAKTLLPTYDVFDEARYFEPAEEIQIWEWEGRKIALAICEDLWAEDPHYGRRLYGQDPKKAYAQKGVDLVLSFSASPFHQGKPKKREALHAGIAKELNASLIYVNQVGANDEILFDGGSFAIGRSGDVKARLPYFKRGFGLIEWNPPMSENGSGGSARGEAGGDLRWLEGESATIETPKASAQQRKSRNTFQKLDHSISPEESDLELLSTALVVGIRDYFRKTGFIKAILGLSGGIDSAVVAVLAVQALGKENVFGVAMPSQHSSIHSLEDAEALARNLGIGFEVRPIKFAYATLQRELAENRGQLAPLALENLQARLRGLILMTLSNHYGAMVLTTSNKSEMAVGYSTLYGDMVGALAPLADVYKTQVYDLAHFANQSWGNPIPERTITKPPSAELAPGQKDEDSLPPYPRLDPLLRDYLEEEISIHDLEKKHGSKLATQDSKGKSNSWVRDVLRKVEISEYKRRQAALVLRVSPKAFGMGRRIPVAKRWDQF